MIQVHFVYNVLAVGYNWKMNFSCCCVFGCWSMAFNVLTLILHRFLPFFSLMYTSPFLLDFRIVLLQIDNTTQTAKITHTKKIIISNLFIDYHDVNKLDSHTNCFQFHVTFFTSITRNIRISHWKGISNFFKWKIIWMIFSHNIFSFFLCFDLFQFEL